MCFAILLLINYIQIFVGKTFFTYKVKKKKKNDGKPETHGKEIRRENQNQIDI